MLAEAKSEEAVCPFGHGKKTAVSGTQNNEKWWPNQLKLSVLHQHSSLSDPTKQEFNYAEEFKTSTSTPPSRTFMSS